MEGSARKIVLVVAATLAWAAPAAHARAFNCDASAVRLTLGGQATVEPVTANRGQATCREVKSQTKTTIGPVTLGALVAETSVPAPTQADAQGGLAQLSVSAAALAGVPIPTLDAIDQLPAVSVPLPANPLLPSSITVDIRPAVKALVSGLQTGPLLEVTGSTASAHARCAGSTPVLSGETKTLDLKVLGQTIPTDAAIQQALTLYNGQTIDPSKLDLSQIVLPPALSFTDPLVGTILQNAVGNVLAQLPPITLPASLLNLSVKPSSQVTADGGLTQEGLSVALSILGQNVINVVVGEARVSVGSVACTPAQAVNNAALACSSRRLSLIDVIDRGRYVALYGAADRRLAGKRIAIHARANGGRVVARPRVSKAGLFRARAPLPPQRYRYTNMARYMAVHGRDKSLNLKLHRRMVFTSVRSRHGKVFLRGVVTRPWTNPPDQILVRQRLTCRKQRVVARLRPDSNGRFSVTLKAPKKGDIGVYRATTVVAFPDPSAPNFRTYTLPGLVRFAR
ncbi:MAG TPA: hypothetical protein VH300_03885 [Thermoleophilaceae bacterium]|jgi:hypothetical protein|nr:hypothetical protein [Thermoleophilaceae bacterium]